MKYILALSFLLLTQLLTFGQYNTDSLNSIYDEQYPVITPNGRSMYFTRSNHPQSVGGKQDKGDIWYSTLIDGKWTKPVHSGNILNNSSWNAVLGFSENGKQIILHHHYRDNKQGLSISTKTRNGWSTPAPISIPYFLNRSVLQSGSISKDGRVIMLSLESYNTKGGEDLYVLTKKHDGTWTDPKNLGNTINSKYQEISPYLAEDNRTLFFATNGQSGGMGSFDIYKSTRLDDFWTSWSTPINLGPDVNTDGRESSYQYFTETNTAMYVSTRDSDGYGDIKWIKKEENIDSIPFVRKDIAALDTLAMIDVTSSSDVSEFSFVGTVKNVKTDMLLASTLFITAINTGDKLSYESDNGSFGIELPIGSYHLGVEAIGYLSKFLTIEIDSVVTKHHITMSPIIIGETVNLNSVLFTRGTDELTSSSYDELDAVVKMMETNKDMEITLGGHTDNQGSSKLNFALSEKRVQSVKKYLQSKGISGRRIDGKGYGGTRPIASNKNEITRKFNRRVEFTVTKN